MTYSVADNPLLKTLDDFKANIVREIKKISKYVLNSVFSNFEKKILRADGGYIDDK